MIKWFKNVIRLICGPSKIESQMFDMVREFNETFSVELSDHPRVKGFSLRYELSQEELYEYYEAGRTDDKVELLDALVDRMYLLIGDIQVHGMEDVFFEAFQEVHASNMSKLGEDGMPIYREDGKVLKGPNYFKPNLRNILDF